MARKRSGYCYSLSRCQWPRPSLGPEVRPAGGGPGPVPARPGPGAAVTDGAGPDPPGQESESDKQSPSHMYISRLNAKISHVQYCVQCRPLQSWKGIVLHTGSLH